MQEKLKIYNIDETVDEVVPLKARNPAGFDGQEDFFDAVRADRTMTDKQKKRWLKLEPENDDVATGGSG